MEKARPWDPKRAEATYNMPHWGDGYFFVGMDGRLRVRPSADSVRSVDLETVVEEARAQGLDLPLLIRVSDILHDRVRRLHQAFARAMAGEGYEGGYTAVYPIKVNQQCTVVEHILATDSGAVGLEAGSKPELMVALARSRPGGVVICNGYKDREYIRLALIGLRLGLRVFIVLEKSSELDLVLEEARALGVRPLLGLRVRLASIGKGKWQNTGGEKSKFGLSAAQVIEAVARLREAEALDCLRLVHCHLGSQIANIRDIQKGMDEFARFYAQLRAQGAPIEFADVGGGLGVDYEGTRSRSECSMNYTMEEYARDVVHALWAICSEHDLPHPHVITESGRAMTAHHALLVTRVIEVERMVPEREPPTPPADAPLVIRSLWETYAADPPPPPMEAYHDAAHWLAEAQGMFSHGVLDLEQRAMAEALYFAICRQVLSRLRHDRLAHRELRDELSEKLADKYFCNFSLFQSLPDVWAIRQVFPIVPLHRLDEPPTRRGVIQDLTCDSDGRIDDYVEGDSVEHTLPLHPLRPGEPYLLGFFLVGAYQEILGDLHNLFGDTHSVNLTFTEEGYRLEEPERGDTVDEILRYIHYHPRRLMEDYHRRVAEAGLETETAAETLALLESGLSGYTYLEEL